MPGRASLLANGRSSQIEPDGEDVSAPPSHMSKTIADRSIKYLVEEHGGKAASNGSECGSMQVPREPVVCHTGNLFQRAGLFKQMGGTWDNFQSLRPIQSLERLPIQFDHDLILTTDDE